MNDSIKKITKSFEHRSGQNPLHESLLTYLNINPVKNDRSLKYLVDYMYKSHMLEDYKSCRYVQCILFGTHFQKDFRNEAEKLGYRINELCFRNTVAHRKISLIVPTNKKVSISGKWEWVSCHDGYYMYKPPVTINGKKVRPLEVKFHDCTSNMDEYIDRYATEVPPFRWGVTNSNEIILDNKDFFVNAIPNFIHQKKEEKKEKHTNNILSQRYTLDWNHIKGAAKNYLIQPKINGITIKSIKIRRNERPHDISAIIQRYAKEMPVVTFNLNENQQIENLDTNLVDNIINQCLTKEKQRIKVEREKEERAIEGKRKQKLQEHYNRLRKKGVDISIFTKTFTLQWSEVRFYNRYFIFEPQLGNRIGQNKIIPLRVEDYRCKSSFNYIQSYLQDHLPPITYRITENFKVELSSAPLFEAALSYLTKEQERREAGVSVMSSSGRIAAVTKRSFDSALSKAAAMKPEDFKRYKSKFIDFLVEHQMDEYKVVPVSENVSHSRSSYDEASFIFTAKSWDGRVFIIIENVNPDRSTILFKVLPEKYKAILRVIFDYIQSDVINKRSAIRDNELDFGTDGVLAYWTFNHDSYTDWMHRLSGYLQQK